MGYIVIGNEDERFRLNIESQSFESNRGFGFYF